MRDRERVRKRERTWSETSMKAGGRNRLQREKENSWKYRPRGRKSLTDIERLDQISKTVLIDGESIVKFKHMKGDLVLIEGAFEKWIQDWLDNQREVEKFNIFNSGKMEPLFSFWNRAVWIRILICHYRFGVTHAWLELRTNLEQLSIFMMRLRIWKTYNMQRYENNFDNNLFPIDIGMMLQSDRSEFDVTLPCKSHAIAMATSQVWVKVKFWWPTRKMGSKSNVKLPKDLHP
ncbi:hypothetical protein VNO78_31147 [Psophocarpus tetragonolobus]|uniref:Uncharacterized protein n=1 Tax=Psophocarpus tetragonolobus TaxID=3891 RepID=A0AAN9RXX2_PSOTE